MIRLFVKSVLRAMHLLPAARRARRWLAIGLTPAAWGPQREIRRRFKEAKRCHGEALGCQLNAGIRMTKTALVVSAGSVDTVGTEIGLLKGLEIAGFTPFILSPPEPWLIRYYRLAGVGKVLFWEHFVPLPRTAGVDGLVGSFSSLSDLLQFQHVSARVGRFAASTALRTLRLGSVNLESADIRRLLVPYLASSMAHAVGASALIQQIKPQLVLFVDRGYTPAGELFDICLANNIDVITWNAAHKDNAIMLKRYRRENRDEHPASLSLSSWKLVRQMDWTDVCGQLLQSELHSCYASGNWYTEVGTQFNARILDPRIIFTRLHLDGRRKTAVIFPHILWDGTFFYGVDLFGSYEAWFVETVRMACANTEVNWLVKVHPGNVVKSRRDGVSGEPSEIKVIQERIGRLPDHVRIIPPDSDISTFSLYSLMDYCVTVRGTVGIEAAVFGIPVLTAGTGRYDGKGFTVDSGSKEAYLERILGIHKIPRLSPDQRELAERFAYGVFLLRPLLLKTVTLEYQRDAKATPRARINPVRREDWLNAPDLRAFSDWVAHSKEDDFLVLDSGQESQLLKG